jgi:hypothetical protein
MFLLIASSRLLRTAEAPADSKALIKNTLSFFDSRLVVTQCYSVVKNHPPRTASHLSGIGHHLRSAQSSAPSDSLVTVTEMTVVAADAQLKAARRAGDRFVCRNFGGADRDRTGDPLVANQVLSQLSYSPILVVSRQYPVASLN